MANTFEPDFKIVIAGKDITADISKEVISLEDSDTLEGESDECSLELHNTDGKWLDLWFPKKGDVLQISLGYKNALVDYSECEIDQLDFEFYPHTVKLSALSTGMTQAIRTRKGKAFENTNLKKIAEDIAKKNKFEVVGTVKEIPINRATQYQEADVEFLLRLSKEYGHTFKVVGKKLVFSELKAIKAQDPVRKIPFEDMLSLSLSDKLKDIAKSAKVKYQNQSSKAYVEQRVEAKGEVSNDEVVVNVKVESKAQAEAKAQSALDQKNDEKTQASLSVLGDPALVAGLTIELTEIGKLSGKYMINTSRHTFNRGSGYTTSLECKRVDDE